MLTLPIRPVRSQRTALLGVLKLAATTALLLSDDQAATARAWRRVQVLGIATAADDLAAAPHRVAQNTPNLTLKILIDIRKNQDFVKADRDFQSFVYEAVSADDAIKIMSASKAIVGTWKGNMSIGYSIIEDDSQFAPVFLVADIRNDGPRPSQVTGAYLAVSESATDLQPFLTLSGFDACDPENYDPKFGFDNFGWGKARNARLVYSFGTKASRTMDFVANLGTFDQATVATVEDGLRKSALNISRVKAGKFKCTSKSQIPACLTQLKGTGVLGNLADYVYAKGRAVFTNVSGKIEYEWVGSDNKTNNRASPFSVDIPLFHFDVGGGPECGAPGPVDRNEKPIELSLDRKNYRIPLNWRGQLGSRQDKRFAFSLAAARSSNHVLTLVVQFADGNIITSLPMDISYFKPRMPPPPPDDPDDKK
jgi:hypothetical protein